MDWIGRVDGEELDVLRIHQVVKSMELDELLTQDISEKKVCFVSFNSDEGIRRNNGRLGAKDGWVHMKKALSGFPIFTDSLKFYDLEKSVEVFDNDLEKGQESLAEIVSKLKERNYLVIVLGGGHDIAYGTYKGILTKALTETSNPKIGIISFDAHFDMRSYENGASSGTMFLQIADECAEKKINFDYNVIGIQKFSNTKRLFDTAKRNNVNYYLGENIRNVSSDDMFGIIKRNDYIHLTICTDVFHITSAPGVSAPQSFGIQPYEALRLIKTISKNAKDLTIDIAEISPRYDYDDRTSRLMANIIYETILSHFSLSVEESWK